MIFIATAAVGFIGACLALIRYKYPWAVADITWLLRTVSFAIKMADCEKKNFLPIDVFEKTVDKFKSKAMIVYKNNTYTFSYIDDMANKIASVALDKGIKEGDTVAILMYNEPAFVWSWLGFQKLGVEVAFINYNQRKKMLLNSIISSGAKALFVNQGPELYKAILDIRSDIENIELYTYEASSSSVPEEFISLAQELEKAPSQRIPRECRKHVNFKKSTNCLVFTSGTTGLPKPAIVTHMRLYVCINLFSYINITADDIIYECLPIYHSAGSLCGVGACIKYGATMVLVEKFSARNFFKDCHFHKVTLLHYVGELFRYLINTPESEFDTNHCIRGALGNGLRNDVWVEFQNRFKVMDIKEFYGATELPFGLVNLDNTVGSVGKMTPFMMFLLPIAFVVFDSQKDEAYRNKNGHCVLAKEDEPGLLIIKPKKGMLPFDGYKNKEDATKKKYLHNVFAKGDVYINSGDLFTLDKDKNLCFYDRLGDTFRWKGENVSTTEVSNIISDLDFIKEVCVYGVEVPGCEGKAGMAAINMHSSDSPTELELEILSKHCLSELASYAIPRFLRIKSLLDLTSTFKYVKQTMKMEGFDITKIQDPIFYFNPKEQKYCKLTTEASTLINTQVLRL